MMDYVLNYVLFSMKMQQITIIRLHPNSDQLM